MLYFGAGFALLVGFDGSCELLGICLYYEWLDARYVAWVDVDGELVEYEGDL